MAQPPTIDRLLNLVPDAPDSVLSYLQSYPDLASKQDAHGYSLLHAATSYEQFDLATALIREYNVDPNITDEDGETCLFNAESVIFARALLELGVKLDARNVEGQTATEKLDNEDEQPQVAAYLKSLGEGLIDATSSTASAQDSANATNAVSNGENNGIHPPPPLPNNVQINIGAMDPSEVGSEPDPEFRRRIEELASRDDFQGEEGQRQLRDLVSEAVTGVANQGQGQSSRRHVG